MELNEYIRSAAFNALKILNNCSIISEKEITDMIDEMLAKELKEDNSIVISDIVTFISSNQIYSRIDLVRKFYNNNRVDIKMIGGFDQFIDDIYGKKDYHENKNMIEDTIKSLSWWSCFNKDCEDNKFDLEETIKKL